MRYEYSGFLKTLLQAPDPKALESVDAIEFSADDLAQWKPVDDDADREWQHITARTERIDEGVLLEGQFEDVRRIDNIDRNDPSFWAPLSSQGAEDPRFPIDVTRFPIVEVTYRCRTPMARPAWVWRYPGGMHFDGLQPTREWRTAARRIPHLGFPQKIDSLTFRLYSVARSVESMEIHSLRFRAMTTEEETVCQQAYAALEAEPAPPRYRLLNEFMPVGVSMKARSARRLAEIMDISMHDYWRLALEDIARHFHNCVLLEEMQDLSTAEWKDLLSLAESYGIRFVPAYDWPMDDFDAKGPEWIETHIRPFADSPAILAWMIQNEPPEHSFPAHLAARIQIEQADPNHPMAVFMREPNSYPLYAPFFAASGMAHFKSHVPSSMGAMIRCHRPLNRGQQFWVLAPAFVYATDTPEWNTCPEMRLLINQAYASGARGWFSFSYHNDPIWNGGSFQRSLTGPFLTFSDLWSELGLRMERFNAITPLLMNAAPGPSPEFDVRVAWREHPKARHAPDVESIDWFWLHGPDYSLLYVVSNDIAEVTPVNITFPDLTTKGVGIINITDFTRNRKWAQMDQRRHLEMFPGQGEIILLAPVEVCERWRDAIAARLLEGDRRQLAIDMELARPYDVPIKGIERRLHKPGHGSPADELARLFEARDQLTNLIYATPDLFETRSKIIQISAGICGCDGTLCRMLSMGKADRAHDLGLKVLPLAREMTNLRVQLREGKGAHIFKECAQLADRTMALLTEIRTLT